MKTLKQLSTTVVIATAITMGSATLTSGRATAQSFQDPEVAAAPSGMPLSTPKSTQTSQMGTQALAQPSGGSFFAPVENVAQQINSFIGDVTGFVKNDIFGSLNNLLSSAMGSLNVPDLQQVTDDIMKTATSQRTGTQLSEALENKTSGQGNGSYAIRSDYNDQAQRNAAIGTTNGATLTHAAQQASKQKLDATNQDTQRNVQLAQESQNLDVTQQILQNLSQQTALNAQVQNRLYAEAQQARSASALGLTLEVQTAKQVGAANIANRQSNIASGNMASLQAGMMMMPGGATLGSDSTESGNSPGYFNNESNASLGLDRE